jgi:serine phosphatase RsbU (regulator of sigma subunit)
MRTISLQQRLLQNLLVVILALGLVVTVLATLATRMAAEDMARSLTRQSIKQSTAELELYFASTDRLLRTIQLWTREGVIDVAQTDKLRSLIQPVLASEPQVSSFLIADSHGRELMLLQGADGWQLRQTDPDTIPGEVRWLRWTGSPSSTPSVSLESSAYDPRKRPWYRTATAHDGSPSSDSIRWNGPYTLLTTKAPGITASMVADETAGRVTVIALDVLLTDISRFAQGLPLSERGGIIVLDDQARLLGLPGATPADGTGVKIGTDSQAHADESNLRPIIDAGAAFSRTNDDSVTLLRFSSGGEAWWAAREAFLLTGDKRLWIQVVVPESELLGRIAALPYTLIGLLLAVLAAAAWRMHAVSQRFTRPISQLVTASDQLRRGDFRAPPPLNTNISEMLRLERAQDRMRIGLEELLRFRRDLQLAREIQQATLPEVLPTLEGFDLEAWTEPADETGGDTYDVIGISSNQASADGASPAAGAVLLLADATGHGVGPALTATAVRSLLRMAIRAGQDLDAIARQINDQLHEDLDNGRFVTAWLAELDCSARRIRCLSAGQAPILSYCRSKNRCEIKPADGPPLGVLPGVAPQAREWQAMAAGDIVAVISDGIFEAANPAGEQYGVERTVAVIKDNAERSARAIREALLDRLRAFTEGHPADDDRTILILKATS